MAGKLGPAAQVRVALVAEFLGKLQRVHSLVEQYAAERKNPETVAQTVKRAFGQLKRGLMGNGLDNVAQLAGSMEIAAGRGMGQITKAKILREGVASIRFQLELEQRLTIADDSRAQEEKAKEKEAAKEQQPPKPREEGGGPST